jgi:aspartate aminotransferase
MYDRASLAALAEVIRGRDLVVVSDDIYQKLTYGKSRFVSLLEVAPDLRDRVVIVNGVSKSYAMTGWRLGYAAGPKSLITAMENMQSQSTSNPTSFVQAAAAVALTADQGCIAEMVKVFERRRDFIVEKLNAIPGVRCSVPPGAFYVFPNVAELYGSRAGDRTIRNSLDLADYLLDARVAVIPGAPFGADNYIRLSYATSDAAIAEGVKRMTEAIGKLGLNGC